MRWLIVALLLAGFLPAHAGHSPPKILFRVYIQTNEDMPAGQSLPVSIPPDNQIIQIRTLPDLSEAELVDVQVDSSGYTHLHLDHHGQVTLDAITAENQGKIMVMMIDGFIVYAPVIDQQISTGELIIPHPLRPDIVQQLQELAKENVRRANKD